MSKPQRLPTEGQCAYCGQNDILTIDHVIPGCLFNGVTSGVPGNVPKVSACRQRNNAKSIDDTLLRDVLVRDLRLTEHPIARTIRHGSHARSISRGKSQYPRAASHSRFVLSPTGSGLWVAEPILPKERLYGIFTRLVRGLMVAYEHYALPSTIDFDVVCAMDTSGMVHAVQAGDGSVFWCRYYHSLTLGHLNLSQWWLRFYEHTIYWIGTDMSNLSLDKF